VLQLGLRNGEIVGIGTLEARVLRGLYEHGDWVPVKHVVRTLQSGTPISYSSVITCLKRMAGKGYLEARKRQGEWLFRPVVSARDLGLMLIEGIWKSLWGPPPAALSRFVTDALLGKLGDESTAGEARDAARETTELSELVQELSTPEPLPVSRSGSRAKRSRRPRKGTWRGRNA